MERQKKPWSNHVLPKEFDVFCIGDMVRDESEGDLKIPGNLYVSGVLNVFNLIVDGTAIIDDCNDAADIIVQGGSCICGGDVIANKVSVFNGSFISAGDVDTLDITIHNGDCIVHNSIDSYTINADGTLDCYDVNPNGHKVYAADYVCRYYEEKI